MDIPDYPYRAERFQISVAAWSIFVMQG